MTISADPCVLFAAEGTLLAWNRSSLALLSTLQLRRSLKMLDPADLPAGYRVQLRVARNFIN